MCSLQLPRMFPRSYRHVLISNAPSFAKDMLIRQRLCISVWRYRRTIRWLLNRYKEGGNSHWTRILALQLSAQALLVYRYHNQPFPDYLVAMPCFESDWRARGFHPAGLITHECGRLLNIKVVKRGLYWIKHVEKQKRAGRQQRWYSRMEAMRAARSLSRHSIAVIDDICTTGACLFAASEALYTVGASSVDVWSLAYNPRQSPTDTSLLTVSALE